MFFQETLKLILNGEFGVMLPLVVNVLDNRINI